MNSGVWSLRNALLDCAKAGQLEALLAGLDAPDLTRLLHDWVLWARKDQLPPDLRSGVPSEENNPAENQDWRVWLILGGRGAGKTRAGAEWVRAQALGLPPLCQGAPARRIALVGETLSDARAVMVEGVSGLLAIHPDHERPVFEPSNRRLIWPNGAIAQLFSADAPESLRGPQFNAAWCDELCKWRHAQATWDMLQFGLRLGVRPRTVVTTTPRPIALLRTIMEDNGSVIARSRTRDNADHLPAAFLAAVEKRYSGSRLGRQELDGEIIDDRPDALWQRAWLERSRRMTIPELRRIVIGVDPPVTSHAGSDACGIVAAAMCDDETAVVIADATVQGREPLVWARRVIALYHQIDADCIVAEVNQGGDLVTTVLQQVDRTVPVRSVRATRGKWLRAEPIAALYAQGRVQHVGQYPELEDEMCEFGPDGRVGSRSPDRVDALVWALTDLFSDSLKPPRVRSL